MDDAGGGVKFWKGEHGGSSNFVLATHFPSSLRGGAASTGAAIQTSGRAWIASSRSFLQ
jgi:hypothetical protein